MYFMVEAFGLEAELQSEGRLAERAPTRRWSRSSRPAAARASSGPAADSSDQSGSPVGAAAPARLGNREGASCCGLFGRAPTPRAPTISWRSRPPGRFAGEIRGLKREIALEEKRNNAEGFVEVRARHSSRARAIDLNKHLAIDTSPKELPLAFHKRTDQG